MTPPMAYRSISQPHIIGISLHVGPFSKPTVFIDSYELPETGGEIRSDIMQGDRYTQRTYPLLVGMIRIDEIAI